MMALYEFVIYYRSSNNLKKTKLNYNNISMKSLTTREWIFIILFLSLLQGIIWYASFVNAGNSSALNYISFAGTLISIILAVLAIGYTYGESISEKNKSNAIANQIDTLNGVLNNLVIQNSNLEIISKINDELLQLSENFQEGMSNTSKKVDDLKSSFENAFEKARPVSEKTEEIPNAKNVLMEMLSKTDSYPTQISLLILYYFHQKKLPINKIISTTKKIFDKASEKSEELEIKLVSQSLYIGGVGIVLHFLKETNLVEEIDNKVILDQSIVDNIIPLLSDLPKKIESYNAILYKTLVSEINSELQS
jgi:hypothetical protein